MVSATPQDWQGSLPEFIVFNQLLDEGLQPGIDFIYQSSLWGGRQARGGRLPDFQFWNPPDLAFNIQGEYYHYGLGAGVIAEDVLLRSQLAGEGIILIFIDESHILENVSYYVKEALQYRDHSQLS